MSKGGDMCVEYYNYRVEFQLRGAGHIHGVLWVDLDNFIEHQSRKDDYYSSFTGLKKAFLSVNNEEDPSLTDCQMLQDYADMFISCTI